MTECLEELEPRVSSKQIPANLSDSVASSPSASSSFSLKHFPPINLPPFSGKFEEWESFRDRFTVLIINNQDISDFARMHFLASSLVYFACDIIDSTEITGDNFTVAWQSLCARYENKRRLIEVHVSNLYNLPTMTRESASELHSLRDKTDKAIASLKRLDRSADDLFNDMLVYFVSQKFDATTRKAWKMKLGEQSTPPRYDELSRFISVRTTALDKLTHFSATKPTRPQKVTSATASIVSAIACSLCKERHFINKCPSFIGKNPSQRCELIKKFNRCFNCLSTKHNVQSCTSKFTCRHCQQKHHSLLHVDSHSSTDAHHVTTTNEQPADTQAVSAHCSFSSPQSPPLVLLATARVIASSPAGRTANVRALLDQGSEVTIISENLAQLLRLKRIKMSVSITAVGCVNAGTCRYGTHITIVSRHTAGPSFFTNAFILKSLTAYAPKNPAIPVRWSRLADLTLADDNPMSSDPIDLIIGADLYSSIILEGVRKGSVGEPVAQNSHLGWILSGKVASQDAAVTRVTMHHCSLDQELRKFWEVEEIPQRTFLDPAEQLCEDHFLTTHLRASDGRYIFRLPFKQGPPIDIGESRKIAERSLNSMNRRLTRNAEQKQQYPEFLAEYKHLGHMSRVIESPSMSNQVVYIPHHSVIRETSSTTRLRVVFNASSSSTNGTSLNDHLLTGPKLQTDLPAILLRWRQHKYVYTADIAKMYRQILVDPRDVNYQRILWARNDSDTIDKYQLLTVTYGTAPAPFLALRVLKQLLDDEGGSYLLAVPVLRENCYVDDVLFGAEDIPLLRQTRTQVCGLLKRGGFELRKWASNSSDLLDDIISENHGLACSKQLQSDESLKILGIAWNPSQDAFQVQVTLTDSVPQTKRTILSTIAKLFDPLGWVTPATVAAKVFMQSLWRLKLTWDDDLPESALTRWTAIYKALPQLNGLQLSRWTGQGSDMSQCELHGFADASTVAYAAAVYLRTTSLSGEVTTSLLAGKSKVAPVQPLSVPRLELSAATLLARLMEFVRASLKLSHVPCHCWTDSTVALAWINDHPSRWKTFVSNRVADIQSRLPTAIWHHVSTAMNPANCASRGLLGGELLSHALWWHGPDWLRIESSKWPMIDTLTSLDALTEERSVFIHVAQSAVSQKFTSRFSSWPKLIRVTAYVLCFIFSCRSKTGTGSRMAHRSPVISVEDCDKSRNFWLKSIQIFSHERDLLLKGKPVAPQNRLSALNPFIDADGIIRVGGRIDKSPLPFNAKHPVLLAAHPLVTLIIRHAHVRCLHGGAQLTLATLR